MGTKNILMELPTQDKWVEIGSGSYGSVYKTAFLREGNDENRMYVAVKKMSLGPGTEEDVRAEYNAARELTGNHPHLPRVYGYQFESKYVYFVMELFEFGSLDNIFEDKQDYTEKDVQSIVRQLVSALSYMLKKNMVHRDIKLENVLVKSWEPIQVALTDFNFSKMMNRGLEVTFLKTSLGTSGYKAPEIYTQTQYDDTSLIYARLSKKRPYDYKVDVWSLGCLLYLLLSAGLLPFRLDIDEFRKRDALPDKEKNAFDVKRIKEKVCSPNTPLRFDPANQWFRVTQEAKNLLQGVSDDEKETFIPGMLVKDPKYRSSYVEIENSKWFKFNFDADGHECPNLCDENVITDLDSGLREQFMYGSANIGEFN